MNSELRSRIFFTLFILVIYRVGTFIPLPGINSRIVADFFSKSSNGIFGVINTFSGGAFQRMSIFALNIMPYITASIIIQLLTSMYKSLEELKKEGEVGRRKLNQYTKYLTLFLGMFQQYLMKNVPMITIFFFIESIEMLITITNQILKRLKAMIIIKSLTVKIV